MQIPAEWLRQRVRQINERNARTHRTADSAALGFVLVLVLGIVGALLLVHYLTPCEAGQLCMGAVVTRTNSGPGAWLARQWFRFRALCRAHYLQTLVKAAEEDLEHMEAQLDWMPHQIRHYQLHLSALRLRQASAEIDARGN